MYKILMHAIIPDHLNFNDLRVRDVSATIIA